MFQGRLVAAKLAQPFCAVRNSDVGVYALLVTLEGEHRIAPTQCFHAGR